MKKIFVSIIFICSCLLSIYLLSKYIHYDLGLEAYSASSVNTSLSKSYLSFFYASALISFILYIYFLSFFQTWKDSIAATLGLIFVFLVLFTFFLMTFISYLFSMDLFFLFLYPKKLGLIFAIGLLAPSVSYLWTKAHPANTTGDMT